MKTKRLYRHLPNVCRDKFLVLLKGIRYLLILWTNYSRIKKPLIRWTKTLEFYIVNLFDTFATLDTLIMISIEAYRASIGKFYDRLRHFANAQKLVSIRRGNVYTILLFLLLCCCICQYYYMLFLHYFYWQQLMLFM